MKTFIALLRGINMVGNNSIRMAELCSLCTSIGWCDVQHYIQSGNLVFSSNATAAALEKQLEQCIQKQFGHSISVIVRPASAWPAYVKSNPFPGASKKEPHRVMLGLSKSRPRPDAAKQLLARATNGERVKLVGDALWIHFKEGAGKSKLTPALFSRFVASPVTLRNWRTVLKLEKMVKSASSRKER
jgi:uncharacterized protein (DUF1697 family)